MTVSDDPSAVDQRHGRDSQEFTRLVNLSDAVFAIAMTLLVLTVDVPDVPATELASALLADLPQIGAYALAFALVASQWYAHRKLFQRLAFTEPGHACGRGCRFHLGSLARPPARRATERTRCPRAAPLAGWLSAVVLTRSSTTCAGAGASSPATVADVAWSGDGPAGAAT